jgi:Domain of unknown function (DUF1707)
VRANPGDEMAASAAGRGHLRASRAEREHVIDVLKAAFVQGMLTKGELDMRVGQTLESWTYAELAALTADIPAGLVGAQPQRVSAPAQVPSPQNRVVNSCACATLAVLAMTAALFIGNSESFYFVVAAISGTLLTAGGRMIYSSHKRRSNEQQQ